MSCTIPAAEELFTPPLPSWVWQNLPPDFVIINEADSMIQDPVVSWSIEYTVSEFTGKLKLHVYTDCRSLLVCLPRVGLQMRLNRYNPFYNIVFIII